jgi:hypothetical protein
VNPPTRPNALSQAEIDKILEGLVQRGARVEMKDPRVTSVNTWLMTAFGTVMLALGGWGINSINRLSESIAVLISQNAQQGRTNDAQDRRMDIYDDRLRTVERGTYARH